MRSTPFEHISQGAFALVIFYTSYIVIGLPETQIDLCHATQGRRGRFRHLSLSRALFTNVFSLPFARSERGACFVGFAADANHFMLQIHPSDNNQRFRNNNNRNSARLPAGRGDEDCTTDFLLIPGGRGNITRYGKKSFWPFSN